MYKGLNKYYYSININYRTNELEQKMLLNLYKQKWNNPLRLPDPKLVSEETCKNIKEMAELAKEYSKRIEEEMKKVEDWFKAGQEGAADQEHRQGRPEAPHQ